jgi:hypothetical protein
LPIEALDLGEVFDLVKVPGTGANRRRCKRACLVALGASLRSAKAAA